MSEIDLFVSSTGEFHIRGLSTLADGCRLGEKNVDWLQHASKDHVSRFGSRSTVVDASWT